MSLTRIFCCPSLKVMTSLLIRRPVTMGGTGFVSSSHDQDLVSSISTGPVALSLMTFLTFSAGSRMLQYMSILFMAFLFVLVYEKSKIR